MTIEYQDSAKRMVEVYLNAVADRLQASRSVDADEVVRDLREHIHRELQELPQPVSENGVDQILTRLGRPEEIVEEQDLSWWQTFILRLRNGPEDWRLAYLSFGLLLLGPIGLLFSFFVSRAAVSLAGEPDPPAKKWLIYPSLIVVYLLIAIWPALLVFAFLGSPHYLPDSLFHGGPLFDHDGLGTIVSTLAVASFAVALWWSLLWATSRRSTCIRGLFRPFAETGTRRAYGKIALLMWALTILLVIAGCFLLYLQLNYWRN